MPRIGEQTSNDRQGAVAPASIFGNRQRRGSDGHVAAVVARSCARSRDRGPETSSSGRAARPRAIRGGGAPAATGLVVRLSGEFMEDYTAGTAWTRIVRTTRGSVRFARRAATLQLRRCLEREISRHDQPPRQRRRYGKSPGRSEHYRLEQTLFPPGASGRGFPVPKGLIVPAASPCAPDRLNADGANKRTARSVNGAPALALKRSVTDATVSGSARPSSIRLANERSIF